MEKMAELLRVDFNRAGADGFVLGFSVKDAGDAARTAHGLDGGAPGAGTLRYLEGDGFGHKTKKFGLS